MQPFAVSPGQRFGRLVVIQQERMPVKGRTRAVARCRCDCGTEKLVRLDALGKNTATQSCGCIQREKAALQGKASTTHGMCGHPEFSRWRGMMARCYRPAHKGYKNYGGRGIRVCSEWHDPAVFAAYLDEELGPCPEGHTLDRIDPDGDYEPGNVRWLDWPAQHKNKRRE
jgi:hypothetical protein